MTWRGCHGGIGTRNLREQCAQYVPHSSTNWYFSMVLEITRRSTLKMRQTLEGHAFDAYRLISNSTGENRRRVGC